jgi:prepilin-type processing-associated H-X9-DG protein
MRQIGLAVENYKDTYGTFPKAAMPNPCLPPEERLSWLVSVVPFVGDGPLYKQIDKAKGWNAEENRFAALDRFTIYRCPSYPDSPPPNTVIPTYYVGMAGLGTDAAELSIDDPRSGFFGEARRLSASNIAGRTSTLLVALETARTSGTWIAAGFPTVRGVEKDSLPYLGIDGQFGGSHRGGATALFADGSGRFIRNSIDSRLIDAIATIRGSEGAEQVGDR